jgi:hypothetical protein
MRHGRKSRVQNTIALFLANKGRRIPLPEIQRVAGAQHGARLREIRGIGYIVDNETERTADGEIHSWYILRAEPGEQPMPQERLALTGEERLRCPD